MARDRQNEPQVALFFHIRGIQCLIWKGNSRRNFNILKIHTFVICFTKKLPKYLKGSHLGSCGTHIGSILGHLHDFGALIGFLWGTHGHPPGPQNWKKVGQRVFLQFYRLPTLPFPVCTLGVAVCTLVCTQQWAPPKRPK